MIAEFNTIPREELTRLISSELTAKLPPNELTKINRVFDQTTVFWAGVIHGRLKAVWGLIPPTLMSDCAYLWLHVVEAPGEHEFLFVRNSQRAIEEALRRFPTIVGHCIREDRGAQRWLRWLGATLERPQGNFVPFIIRARHEPQNAG